MWLEGNVSVKAAVLAGRRDILRVCVDEQSHNRDTAWILHRCEERNIRIEKMKREKIDAMASGRTHGGILAECGDRNYQSVEDCLEGVPFLALVEGVEDPFNLGYIARSLYSAGCTGLLLRNRDWSGVEPVIIRSSAGAYEQMNVVMCDDLATTVEKLRKQGIKSFAAMRKDAIAYTEADYTGPVLIAVGGEMRGLSSTVLKQTDQNIYIPYANDFRMALNAAGAAAVLGFEVLRQRNS